MFDKYTTNGTARRLPENNLATRLLRMYRYPRILDANSVGSLGTVGCEEKGSCRERDTRISDQDEAKHRRPITIELAEIPKMCLKLTQGLGVPYESSEMISSLTKPALARRTAISCSHRFWTSGMRNGNRGSGRRPCNRSGS